MKGDCPPACLVLFSDSGCVAPQFCIYGHYHLCGIRGEMGNDEKWDREEEIERLFDSDNIAEFLENPPEEFIAIIVNQIRQEIDLINAWSKLLDENPQFRPQTFQVSDKEIAAIFFTETIMRSARIIMKVLDTTSAYRERLSATGDQEH